LSDQSLNCYKRNHQPFTEYKERSIMPKLTDNEVEEFLSERGHLARIGTVDADGMPRVLPLWFIIRGDELLFTPRSPAIIWKNIERDPRVGI
jgi:predicted pyridoxine 5'-phosphate oxidase superfamily flavin-nucleotide-binding protein